MQAMREILAVQSRSGLDLRLIKSPVPIGCSSFLQFRPLPQALSVSLSMLHGQRQFLSCPSQFIRRRETNSSALRGAVIDKVEGSRT